MEDGAPAHYVVSMRKWSQERGVKHFDGWPGKSPDLNLNENLWIRAKHAQHREHNSSIAGLKKIA